MGNQSNAPRAGATGEALSRDDKSDREITQAIEAEALATAEAVRARRRVDVLLAARDALAPAQPGGHMTRKEYAESRRISKATISRLIAAGMPVVVVGTTDRIDPEEADAWRRARARRPTTPTATPRAVRDDIEVGDALAGAGLRVARGA